LDTNYQITIKGTTVVFCKNFRQVNKPKARCWATPQRWLLTLDMISFRAALWNPFNLDKVELPSLENNLPQNCKCLLSCEPVSPGCVVLVVDADEPVIWFCYVGGKKWTRHEYNIIVEIPWLPLFLSTKRRCEEEHRRRCSREEVSSEFILEDGNYNGKRTRISSDAGQGMTAADPSERIQIRSIVAVERKFYFDMSPTKLGVLEFHPEPTFTTLEFERLPIAEYCWESSSPHLVESRGRLFLAVRARGHHLYKMDFSRLAWSTVDGLYDQVFFLGRLHFTASYSAWELGLKQREHIFPSAW